MSPLPDVSASELEIDLGWADANPELFLASVSEFYEAHPRDVWEQKLDLTRANSMILRADRWPPLNKTDRDSLSRAATEYLTPDKPWRKAALQAVLSELGLSRVCEAETRAHRLALEDLIGGRNA